MKIYVMYDDHGKIRGTLATPHANVGARPHPGLHVHSFERSDLGETETRTYLHELHKKHRVEIRAGQSALVAVNRTEQ